MNSAATLSIRPNHLPALPAPEIIDTHASDRLTLTPIPARAPTYATRVPRANTEPTRSTPTSSVIHASYEPEQNVQPNPHNEKPPRISTAVTARLDTQAYLA